MLQEKNGILYYTFDIFNRLTKITAAVSARKGGVSSAPFASLNMSFSSGDDAQLVLENRRLYLEALHIAPEDIICCNQVHGIHIEQVGNADKGRGALEASSAIPACDGLMTHEAGVPLTMNFADCTPLLFFDPVHDVIAISHGGWRGTAGNIAAVTLERMHEAYGTQSDAVLAAIGPAIGACCFEVGKEVIDQFMNLFSPSEMQELARPVGEKYYLDLAKANKMLMLRAGIRADHLEEAHICTYCRDDLFFSYRKASKHGEKTGRHMAVIMMNEGAVRP